MGIADEDALHTEVDVWLENVPEGRCPGAYVAEQFAEWQASRKVEAAPSDTDREALIEALDEATSGYGTGFWNFKERDHLADTILAAGFSRTSQPVQVEVTDDMVEKALNVYRMRTAERIDVGAFRAALSAALGGGDHAE